jgi:hypothetical protein
VSVRLVGAQSFKRVEARGAARGQSASQKRHCEQVYGRDGEDTRVARTD